MIQAVRNAMRLPDLRRKLLYTLLILVIYRLAAHVPVPGVDQEALQGILGQTGGAGGLLNVMNLLSGGAMARFSILANGVQAYITATLIFQLLTPIIPGLERLKEEGEEGQRKLNQWSYYITVPLSLLQSYGWIRYINYSAGGTPVLPNFGFASAENILPTISVLVAMTAGTMFAVWLGELITEQGIGSGVSLIIFSGIVAGVPRNIQQTWLQGYGDEQDVGRGVLMLGTLLAILVITMFVAVFVQEGERRIPVQYGKRVRGTRMVGGGSTHIPVKVNTAGMIPLIFAQSILSFPAIVAQFFASGEGGFADFANGVISFFSGQNAWYAPVYFVAVVGFTYFYTDMMVQQQDLPGSLQRQGGFIPGIRPGKRTADYVYSIYRRITLVGALFLGAVAVLPYVVDIFMATGALLVTSSGILIVVSTVLDILRQLEAQLLMRHYEGFMR